MDFLSQNQTYLVGSSHSLMIISCHLGDLVGHENSAQYWMCGNSPAGSSPVVKQTPRCAHLQIRAMQLKDEQIYR